MKKNYKFLALASLLLIGFNWVAEAQISIRGTLLEGTSQTPLPFANIGILNSNIGTISNADGSFEVVIPPDYYGKELIFSALGYAPVAYKIQSLDPTNTLTVVLEEKTLQLEALEINSSKKANKSIRLGNGKSLLLSGQLYNDTASAGSAMALLIDKSKYSDFNFVQVASLYIARNKLPNFKVRLRLKEVDKNGLPGADLYPFQSIEYSSISKGWLDFHPAELCYVEADSFFLMFEWILEKKDRVFIARQYANYMEEHPDRVRYDTVVIEGEPIVNIKVPTVVTGTIFGTTATNSDLEQKVCYQRSHSFAPWKRSAAILSAKVTLSNGPP